jgi:hypothetical protein
MTCLSLLRSKIIIIRVLFKILRVKSDLYKLIILPVVLYVCEMWSLTFTEEFKLQMLQNRVHRRMYGRKNDVVSLLYRSSQSFIGILKCRRLQWVDIWLEWERQRILTEFW